MFNQPEKLGMAAAFKMTTAPKGKTFYYRHENKRMIETVTLSDLHLNQIKGPLVYGVTDNKDVLRYVGKWASESPLYARWFRHNYLHHQKSSRNIFINELDENRGPLTVWTVSANKLKKLVQLEQFTNIPNKELVKQVEALWISRWKSQLWNKQTPSFLEGFTDNEYWHLIMKEP